MDVLIIHRDSPGIASSKITIEPCSLVDKIRNDSKTLFSCWQKGFQQIGTNK